MLSLEVIRSTCLLACWACFLTTNKWSEGNLILFQLDRECQPFLLYLHKQEISRGGATQSGLQTAKAENLQHSLILHLAQTL